MPQPAAPLIPPHALWFFAVSPPFVTLLFTPILVSRGWETLAAAMLHIFAVSIVMGLWLYFAYVRWLPKPFTRLTARWQRGLVHVGVVAVAVATGYLTTLPMHGQPSGEATAELHVLYTASVMCGLFVLVTTSYQQLLEHARTEHVRAQRLERTAVEAQLSALRARVNPHFLFNAFNAVSALAHEDPYAAEETLGRVADLFRYALDGSRARRVALGRELAMVGEYLAIEQVRLGGRLQIALDVDDALHDIPVPPLFLQPLVENAVRHGATGRRGQTTVRVHAVRRDDALVVSVEDDGPGPGRSSHRGTGNSMRELRERLALELGSSAALTIEAVDPNAEHPGCRVTVRLSLDDVSTGAELVA